MTTVSRPLPSAAADSAVPPVTADAHHVQSPSASTIVMPIVGAVAFVHLLNDLIQATLPAILLLLPKRKNAKDKLLSVRPMRMQNC